MSDKHPIVTVTGSSGAGRGLVRSLFEKVCSRQGIRPAFVNGESFHRFTRAEMRARTDEARAKGDMDFSHFGPDANLFEAQDELYRTYAASGTGRVRDYVHTQAQAVEMGHPDLLPGEFTPWRGLEAGSDLLVYEGLHGVVKAAGLDLSRHVDLKLGIVPVMNLEWIQKIHRDTNMRGYSSEAVVDTILGRMHDYVHYILPQFKISDINFQHVAVVDTSDPVIAREVPSLDERVVVIRFRKPEDFTVDFPWLLNNLPNAYMSRRNTLVIPGSANELAKELILTPILRRLMDRRARAA